jgi:hypothetical protein
MWNGPYHKHGLLLGCEVAGKGRFVDPYEHAHSIQNLDDIVGRCVFLLPVADMRERAQHRGPKVRSSDVAHDMKKDFPKI